NEVVERFSALLDRRVGSSCRLALDLCQEPTTVRADSGLLNQVLMNLAVNAKDAMPEGGVITLTTRHCKIDEQTARSYPDAHAGLYIRLSVMDTGMGIPLEDQSRVFEPLFTTKKEGEGTGLGLATVHTIVHQHQGWLDLDSIPGGGTTFHINLPAAINPA
ncbi:MAG: hypothetical protein EA425_10805, partial [Puniceicoccaceae bacterium]